MSTERQRTCPSCGNELRGAIEFCPVCMLCKGLADGVESAESSFEESFSRTPEQAVQRFEHYELVTGEDGNPVELGRGAMGVTYKAFDVDLRCLVTLKVISEKYLGDESARLRFLREARAAARLRHSNVASVLHLGRTGSSYFYAMEFVEGETLENLIKRSGRVEVKLALEIATQVAAGLTAVHKQKLVHRDIKPSNIMVSVEDGSSVTAKIIDLGLAKPSADAAAEAAISILGAFVGTPEFASPEQFVGVCVDIRSDLYSLGVTIWKMLTGKVPFHGTPAEVMYQHQHVPLPLEQLAGIPQPVVVLFEVLLEKDPKWRFQNPAELVNALPKVTDAIKARRAVTHQNLRTITDEQLGKRSNATSGLPRSITALGSRRAQLILWASLALLVAAGLITIISTFFRVRHPHPDASIPALSATKIPERSIAVLPFESLSDNKSDTYFADGVQDEILNSLARIAQLKVISRTSVMQYRGNEKRDLRQIAAALGVANVLEGTVRRDGNYVRVSTELIDASNDNMVWADSYDRDLTNIFAVQSEIAQTVAAKLSAQLSPEERKGIEEKPTNNLEAYDLYLQAKQLIGHEATALVLLSNEREAFSKGIKLLEEATQKDPKFALAYCLIAKAHDFLYSDLIDHTPERRALGDAAVNEALRLRPDLSEVHLAAALHLYTCYQDFERARVQINIAERNLLNNPDLLELTALIDGVQGRWGEAARGLEKAVTLDPRNPELLAVLEYHYLALRRYRDCDRILDRLIELQPDQPLFAAYKAENAFEERGDLKRARAVYESLPSSVKNDIQVTEQRVYYAACDRDFKAAHEIVRAIPDEETFFAGALAPRRCADIWLEMVQGNHPTMGEFGVTREQLSRKVEADPTNATLLSALAAVDGALGRKEVAISEGKRAIEMLPISKDAVLGPNLVNNLGVVYVWTNEPDLAFETLSPLTKIPHGYTYGILKFDPVFDPIRKDSRFDKLLAELAPHD